jgi:pyruvate dehydrogenase E1 component alpha subunit
MAKATTDEVAKASVTGTDLVALYTLMLRMRRFEESLYRKYREGKIGGYLHRYDGQEALVAGIIPLLRKDDYVLCTYRDHGHALACGTDAKSIMAELMGKATGCAAGKGGSMHLIDPDHGFYGGDGIVGGPVPIALGVGYAITYRGSDQVCVCYFGDGAINQGGVHEAMNMAALYGVPVLFVLENNGYAMGTSVSRSTLQTELFRKAEAHGIAAERIDGMDAVAVREAAGRAIRQMRKNHKPHFLEAVCYRYVGHGVADNPQQQRFYRAEEEIERWKARDPIKTVWQQIEREHLLTAQHAADIDAAIQHEIAEAIEFAETSPDPPLDSLYENVYS